jgi:hypothetical protein
MEIISFRIIFCREIYHHPYHLNDRVRFGEAATATPACLGAGAPAEIGPRKRPVRRQPEVKMIASFDFWVRLSTFYVSDIRLSSIRNLFD